MSKGKGGRIAILVADGLEGKGGIERIMLYLTRELAVRHPDLGNFIQQTRFGPGKAIRHATTPLALAQFATRCATGKVSLAHVNVAPRGSTLRKMLFAKAARAAGVPVLLHLHGSGYDEYYASRSAAQQKRIGAFFRAAEGVVVLGDHWERFMRDTLMVDPGKITVVENGVPNPGGGADPANECPVITFMGAVGERKGVDVLIPALGKVAARGIPFRARIGGNGDLDHYKKMASEAGIAERVTFLGWVGEDIVDREMCGADIFVLPSRAENQPVAIIEAMARGLPVISTAIGAIPETVIDGVCGLIVPPGEVDPLATAIEALAQDAAMRQRMGKAGRARWQEKYSIAAVADRMADRYRALMK
jgi:glycosyltransferase involved in cell wall biosynthesis